MTEIEKIELESVDEDIKKSFIKFENGKYPLGLPTQIQMTRKLTDLCKLMALFENKNQGHQK